MQQAGAELVENLVSILTPNPFPEVGSRKYGSALAKMQRVWQAPGHGPLGLSH